MRALFTKLSQSLVVLLCSLALTKTASAQLKIGDNPTSVRPSSILELESDRQGLLLTRLDDTVNINALNPPAGTLIFLNSDSSLRIRSNGYWKKLAEFSTTNVKEIAAGAVSNTGNPNGISIITLDSLRTIVLHAADATNPGIVTAGTQTFGGNKTFQDTVTAAKTLKAGSAGNANSTVQIDGSLSLAIRTVTSATTANATDNTILANTTSGAFTLTLPSPTGLSGRIYTIKKVGGGLTRALTIAPSGSETIDGGSSFIIYNDWTFVALQTDGANWYIIKR